MKVQLVLAMAGLLLAGLSSGALAQRNAADRADRGQRLESDAFRNDMLQGQLKTPGIPAPQQAAPAPTSGSTSRTGKKQ